jgi:hypothetical protein
LVDTAYLLVSAATTLLRCTVESSDVEQKKQSSSSLLRFLHTLRQAREVHDWDLSVLCVETCGQSIERIAAAIQIVPQPSPATLSPAAGLTSRSDQFAPNNFAGEAGTVVQPSADDSDFSFSLDIPWDHLWDDLSEPWRLLDQP